jgi:hypothetical protein
LVDISAHHQENVTVFITSDIVQKIFLPTGIIDAVERSVPPHTAGSNIGGQYQKL